MLSYMLPGEGKSSSPHHVHQTMSNQQKSRLQLDLDTNSLESAQNSAPKMTPIIRTVEVTETRYKELRHPVTGQVLDATRDQNVQEMVFSNPQILRDRLEKTMIKQTNSGQVPFEKTTYTKTQAYPIHQQFTTNNNNTSEKSPYMQISGVIKHQPALSTKNEINRQFISNESNKQRIPTNATDFQKINMSNNDSSMSNKYFNDSGVSTGDEESGSAAGGPATSPSASDTSTPLAHNAGKKLLQGQGKPGLK
ncbi:uncharacterized protein LOC113374489, partial [Ctenocephalides felis]|uniref:uncharacterized protein LOC113374489 n=1 Tax=Ctenocephalides felis TaxID=7515 RepID=UPI000E6E4F89